MSPMTTQAEEPKKLSVEEIRAKLPSHILEFIDSKKFVIVDSTKITERPEQDQSDDKNKTITDLREELKELFTSDVIKEKFPGGMKKEHIILERDFLLDQDKARKERSNKKRKVDVNLYQGFEDLTGVVLSLREELKEMREARKQAKEQEVVSHVEALAQAQAEESQSH